MSLSPLLASPEFESHDETQRRSESQIETQDPKFESHFETPTGTPDLDQERTHTQDARAREADPTLPLVGETPPPRCAHPHKHAWCEGRVHVPRDLHFELLDRNSAVRMGKGACQSAGRRWLALAHLSPEADIGNAYTFWKAAYEAWTTNGARRRGESRRRPDGIPSGTMVCGHEPMCASRHACIDRTIAEGFRVNGAGGHDESTEMLWAMAAQAAGEEIGMMPTKKNSSRNWLDQSKPMQAWVGFCDDLPHFFVNERGHEVLEVFRTKAQANRCYEDARAVTLTLRTRKP